MTVERYQVRAAAIVTAAQHHKECCVPKRNRDVISDLAHILAARSTAPADDYKRLFDATAGHDRVLLALYSLLTAGSLFLLFMIDVSPWSGAVFMTSAALFVVGLGNTVLRMHSYDKMLLSAMLNRADDAIDDSGEWEDLPEALSHTNELADGFQNTETRYLFLGLIAIGVATAIDHWPFVWRGFVVLCGVFILVSLMSLVIRWTGIGNMDSHPSADVEDE